MERVGFHLRAAAFLADLLLFATISNLAALVDYNLNAGTTYSDFGAITVAAAWLTLAALGVLEATAGATPGKWLVGLRIRGEDGHRPPRGRLVGRAAFKYLPVVLAIFPILVYAALANLWSIPSSVHDGLTALFIINTVVAVGVMIYVIVGCFGALRDGHQAAHDQVAGTAVFRARELAAVRGFAPLLRGDPSPAAAPDATHDLPLAQRAPQQR